VGLDVGEPGANELRHRDTFSVADRRVLEFGHHLGDGVLRPRLVPWNVRATRTDLASEVRPMNTRSCQEPAVRRLIVPFTDRASRPAAYPASAPLARGPRLIGELVT
jgi:hypothetical protein